MSMTHKAAFFSFLLLLASASFLSAWPSHRNKSAAAPASRKFSFTYQVHVPADQDAQGKFLLWLPLPQDDGYQKIAELRLDSPVSYTEGHDPEYNNPFALLRPTPAQLASGFDVSMRFVVTRFEHKADPVNVSASSPSAVPPPSPAMLQRYLEPDKLVPLNGVIAELAKEHTAGDPTAMAKARHIYDYVVSTMHYDKSGEGWGRGDAVWACTSKRGNCTDFHSLLIGMMRASGIPARFEIGFPLPDAKNDGVISGYHCWAEFYVKGAGWIPVDASEASKNPDRRDYFFGAHDANRVFFTFGRDLRLSPEQQGDPLNYFIYPYAELNGKPVSGLQTHFSFNDLSVSFSARAH